MKTRGRLCVCAGGHRKNSPLDWQSLQCVWFSGRVSPVVISTDSQSRVLLLCVCGGGRGCYLCTGGFKFLTLPRAIFKAVQMCGRECACVCVSRRERKREE